MNVYDQAGIDKMLIELDGTENKGVLEKIALGVSLTCAKAAAASLGMELYNYIGGANAKSVTSSNDEHHEWWKTCRLNIKCTRIHDYAK